MSTSLFKFFIVSSTKKSIKGFTIIELLIVVVIMAILSGLALPSLLKQSLKARQATAKSHIGAVNRAQQAYRLEHPTFAGDIASLGVGIPLSTNEYNYAFGTTDATVAEFTATPTNNNLSAFTGCTNATIVSGNDANTSINIKEKAAMGGGTATPPTC